MRWTTTCLLMFTLALIGAAPARADDNAVVVLGLRSLEGDDEFANSMTEALRARKPGDTVRIRVLREGRELTVTAVLGERGG